MRATRAGRATWLDDLALYPHLVAADVRSQLQYRLSFVTLTLGSFASLFVEFGAVLILFQRFPHLAGWRVGDVAFLYGLAAVSFGLAEFVCGGFDHLPRLLVQGEFDRVLTRPVDPFVQLFGREFQLRRLGRIGQGLAALLLGQGMAGVAWTLPKLLYLPAACVGGALVFAALFILGATLCFWTVQTSELTNVFTHGGTEMVSYPMEIYEEWFRRFFTFVVPLAFVTYFPALYFLDRPDALGLPGFFPFLSPAVGAASLVVARIAWSFGVRRYQSTGS